MRCKWAEWGFQQPDRVGAGAGRRVHREEGLESGWRRGAWRMVAGLVLIVNYFMSLLPAHSNEKARIRIRLAEVEWSEGVGGIETIW